VGAVIVVGARVGRVGWMLALLVATRSTRAQELDSSRCDSVVAAARVDSVPAALYVAAARVDGELPARELDVIASSVGSAFVAPRPFQLSVFSGPVLMHALRPRATEAAQGPRRPTVSGVYRYTLIPGATAAHVQTLRAALMRGFDSAAVRAIIDGGMVGTSLASPDGSDSMRIEIRLSSDSIPGSRRVASATFPVLPVVDAVPLGDNPAPLFPEAEKRSGAGGGEVVFRVVVDRSGIPVMETVEVARATSLEFLKAAIASLPAQRFSPATIHGCAVAQQIQYAFSFVQPAPPSAGVRFRD